MSTLSMPLLNLVNDFVSAHLGLNFAPQRWADLQRGIGSAAHEFGFDDLGAFLNWLFSSPLTRRHVEVLASHLTIGETYFFREPQSFRMLEEHVLPQFINERRGRDQRLRIWSAGCCTGEEAYSLAISVSRVLPDRKNWDVMILATDINPDFLRRASEGIFGEWSFRDAPASFKARYFTNPKPGRYEVLADIKQLVTFDHLNLADNSYPSPVNHTQEIDVIFCRNVIIYLDPHKTQQLVQKLQRCLVQGGWLFVGATETSHTLFSDLKTVNLPGVICYRKDSGNRDLPSEYPYDSRPVRLHEAESHEVRTNASAAGELEDSGHELVAASTSQAKTPQHAEPLKPAVIVQLAKAHADRGELAEALSWCEKALQIDKLDARMHYLRGTILQEYSQSAEAAASFKKALYLIPDFVMAHFALGYLAHREGKHAAARKHFGHALELLDHCAAEEIVPESEGITAGRLSQIIASVSELELVE